MRWGRRVPQTKAEETKRKLQDKNLLHHEYKPIHEDNTVIFPVRQGYDGPAVKREFERFAKTPSFEEQAASILDDDELDDFISSYDIIGDIALIQVPDSLLHRADQLGEALLEAHQHISTVRRRNTARTGKYRLRQTDYVAGEKKTKTTHTEHGVDLTVDIDDVYFSPRLSTERRRIADLVEDGEDVLVMFGGCAPYACVIAAHAKPSSIVSVEWNPAGHALAEDNVDQNNVDDIVRCVNGDVDRVVPRLNRFDRVIMPAPHNAADHTSLLNGALKDTGKAHVYRFQEGNATQTEWLSDISGEITVPHIEHCGDKNPALSRVCYDLYIDKP